MSSSSAVDRDPSVESGVGIAESEPDSPARAGAQPTSPPVVVVASGEEPAIAPSPRSRPPSAAGTTATAEQTTTTRSRSRSSSPSQSSASESGKMSSVDGKSLSPLQFPRPRASTNSRDNLKPIVYELTYYGNVVLDRRITQPMLPWIVTEKRRNGGLGHALVLQVSSKGALGISERKGSILFEHRLHNISRFARGHDKKCFGYLWRPDSNENFRCFVFRASDDDMVHAVVTSIRESDKENIPQSMQQEGVNNSEAMENVKESNSTMFEVMYCGRISVSHKRAPPTFIDESIEKFKEHEMAIQRRKRHFSSDDRQRSASDGAAKVPFHSHSLDIVQEDEEKSRSNLDLSTAIRNLQNNNSNDSSRLCTETSPLSALTNPQSHTDVEATTTGRQFGTLPRMDSYTKLMTSKENTHNRTMVFQIGKSVLTLISLDKKSFMMTKKFSEISFCSQGIKQPEYFGFICREKSASLNYMCYVFKCQSESVVDCIMNTLRQAFNAALHHSKLHVICETCPMHQLHKLCQEVEGQSETQVWHTLTQYIASLGVTSSNAFTLQMKNCQVASQQEQNHLAMMFLMKVCEQQQQTHIHISDSSHHGGEKDTLKSDPARQGGSKLESLKKAKKSLASSFENLLSRNKNRSSPEKLKNGMSEDGSSRRRLSGSSLGDSPCPTPPVPSPNSGTTTTGTTSATTSPVTSPSTSSSTSSTASTSSDDFQSPDTVEGKGPSQHHPHHHLPTKQASADSAACRVSPLTTITRERSKTLGDIPTTPTTPSTPTSRERTTFQFEGDQFKALRPIRQKPPLVRAMSVGGRAHMFSPGQSPRTPNLTPSYRMSWRQAIFNRVVTPMSESKAPPTFEEQDEYVFEEAEEREGIKAEISPVTKPKRFTSRLAVKALWQRAIREQIILNRMEKENKRNQARLDAVNEKKMKLNYEEITPCLKEVTKQWDKLLALPNRQHTVIPYEDINKLYKEGVPRTRRGDIWMMLSEQRLLRLPPGGSQIPESEPYPELLKQLTTHQHAILIDLGRTYPNHPYFSNPLGRGQLSLFNLLKAYSLQDDEVGYCQGLSFVAGVLLMHMEEQQAFKMLEYLMFSWGFRRQYKPDMTALQIQMYQLSRLLHDFHHRLHDHLEQNDVAPSLYAAPWFLTLFASQFPLGFVAKVFDLIFLQGFEVIFKVALVILGSHEELILQCDGFESIIDFVKNQLPSLGIVQMEKVINKAYKLDISKQLHAYEVEYHVIQEEMLPSPVQSKSIQRDIEQLETSNRNLRRHNNELLEQLQSAHNTIHNQRSMLHSKQETETNLRSELRTLNLERAALLDTIAKLRDLVPDNILNQSGLDLVHLTSLTTKSKTDNKAHHAEDNPQHHQMIENAAGDNISIDDDSIEDMDNEVASITRMQSLREERSRNHSGGSLGSELSASTNTSEADLPSIVINDARAVSAS
ncbi:TBC1 domain family member 1-like [Diadema antillarum]|uniref:TBC1 domain family member 1-like n=1 Tax=Diadema antillarum TaxID=105358 RepID=UPI003A87DFFB